MKLVQTIFIIISVMSGYGQSQNPQVINISGNYVEGNGYSVEWSVGELTLVNQMTSADNSYIVTNGFLQPYPGKPGHPQNVLFSPASVVAFPNPTQDIVTINFDKIAGGKISIQLMNDLGQIVYTNEILIHGLGFVKKINMKDFRNGIYLLSIKKFNPGSGQYEMESGSYKIIKQ